MSEDDWKIVEKNGIKYYQKEFKTWIIEGINREGEPCIYQLPGHLSKEEALNIILEYLKGKDY